MIQFRQKKSAPVLAIETADGYLKWLVARRTPQGPLVLEAGIFKLSSEKIKASEKISDLIKKYKINSHDIISCIPRRQVTTRSLEVPSTDLVEVKKIVDLQAIKQTPYSADEVVHDFYALPPNRVGYSNVMLVVAHREVVNAHMSALETVGLKSSRMLLATQGSVAWLTSQGDAKAAKQVSAVLDVDIAHTDFFVHEGDHLLFSRSLSVGAENFIGPGAIEAKEKFFGDLLRTCQIYRSESFSKEPQALVLTGAYEGLRSEFNRIEAETHLQVKEGPRPETLKFELKGDAPQELFSLIALLGSTLADKQKSISLVPQEVVMREDVIEKGRQLMVTGVFAMSIFLLVISLFASRFYQKKSYLKWLDQKIATTSPEAGRVDGLRKSVKYAEVIQEGNKRVLKALAQVHEKIPNQIYLTLINCTKDGHFQMQGRADSITDVFSFSEQLKASLLFRDLEAKRLTKRIVDNHEVVDFEIDSVFVSAVSDKPVKPGKLVK